MPSNAAFAGPHSTWQPPAWKPRELGLPRATLLSLLLVAVIIGFCLFASNVFAPKPPPPVIQVTQAQLVTLPKPTPPPPPPKVIPPPKPLPVTIAKPPPVQSKIVVPTKPTPPVHHVYKPIPHPVAPHPPTPTPPVQQPPAPPAAAAPPTNGIPIYESQMHAILQANQSVPPALASLGISGTAIVRVTVAPDGHVISATIAKSSGNSLIDDTALDHARNANFHAFNANMPQTNQTFTVPIEIDAEDADQ